MIVYYKNHNGKVIDLKTDRCMLQTGDILDYEWEYTTIQYQGLSRISGFLRKAQSKEVTVTVKGLTSDEYADQIDFMLEVFEEDIAASKAGKLYINNFYLSCYILSSKKAEWGSRANLHEEKLVLITDYPVWIREKKYIFRGIESSVESEFLDFPFDFPFDFTPSGQKSYIRNEHYLDCHFSMEIYGPVSNPFVEITGHKYQVFTVLGPKDCLIINSRDGTIKKYTESGRILNEFNNRFKESDIFKKISPGENTLYRSGTYKVVLTLYMERSEPMWRRMANEEYEPGLDVFLLDGNGENVLDGDGDKIQTGGAL